VFVTTVLIKGIALPLFFSVSFFICNTFTAKSKVEALKDSILKSQNSLITKQRTIISELARNQRILDSQIKEARKVVALQKELEALLKQQVNKLQAENEKLWQLVAKLAPTPSAKRIATIFATQAALNHKDDKDKEAVATVVDGSVDNNNNNKDVDCNASGAKEEDTTLTAAAVESPTPKRT
jgi:hypothetical protein